MVCYRGLLWHRTARNQGDVSNAGTTIVTDYFSENIRIPIDGAYDVIVVGGGVAGIGAALAAARNGLSTLLVEKGVMLGGLATAGLIAHYLPLCDGNGRQVIGGIAEELLYASIRYGYDTLPAAWKGGRLCGPTTERYQTRFSAPAFALALDELVEKAGISVLLDTTFSRPVMEDENCRGIVVENKSGRRGFTAKIFIDTTGDADLMARAGVACVEQTNWLSIWFYVTDMEAINKAAYSGDLRDAVQLRALGVDVTQELPDMVTKYRGTDAAEVSRAVLDGHRLIRQAMTDAREVGRCLLTLPSMAQLRTTRRIRGRYELCENDVGRRFDDSIGCTGDWRQAGPVFEIPWRTLLAPEVGNVITAGRTIAAVGDVWEVTRVIPTAVMTGQAAGTAASLALAEGCSLAEVPVNVLQNRLKAADVRIHV